MHRYRYPSPYPDEDGSALQARVDRDAPSSPMRADRFERHRNHHREQLTHDVRCQEADQEIREVLRRY